MLGELLEDPDGVEEGGCIKGMGLLPLKTVFKNEKRRTRVKGTIEDSLKNSCFGKLAGREFEGYEIHMGKTDIQGDQSPETLCHIKAFESEEMSADGFYKDNVFGTYVHGIFETPQIAEAIVEEIALTKGIEVDSLGSMDAEEYKNMQYDLLADTLRKHLDMKKIYEILEAGI